MPGTRQGCCEDRGSRSLRLSAEWEKVGQVPNVVFVEGMAQTPERWLFYYGGADKYVGAAWMPPLR